MSAVNRTPASFTCPNCQSPPGEPCTQPNSRNGRTAVRWFHLARSDRALTFDDANDATSEPAR